LEHLIETTAVSLNPDVTCVDEYGQDEKAALEHLVWAMAVLESVHPVTFERTPSQAFAIVDGKVVEFSVVYGPSHLANFQHAEETLGRDRQSSRVVFSCPRDGVSLLKRDGRYTKGKPRFARVAYPDMVQLIRTARTQAELVIGLMRLIDEARGQTNDRIC
jgi:hypothetical protein